MIRSTTIELNFYLIFFIFIFFFSCSEAEKELIISYKNEYKIEDQHPQLGEIHNFHFINESHFITYDNQINVKEFIDFQHEKVVGSGGSGPCEYGAINNFTFNNHGINLLDRDNSKLIIYNSDLRSCWEFYDDIIPRILSIETLNDEIYLFKGTFHQNSDPETAIAYKVSDFNNSAIKPLNIQLNQLDIDLPSIPLRLSMASSVNEDYIIFYYPLNKKYHLYDIKKDKIRSINIDLKIDDDIYKETDIMTLMDLINNEIEIVFDIFALDNDNVAIVYRRGINDEQIWGVKLYDKEGLFLGGYKFNERIIYVDELRIFVLNLALNNIKNPYSVTEYSYEIK